MQENKEANFIGGQWVKSNGEIIHSENPASGEILWQAASAQLADVDAAVAAARDAFTTWRLLGFAERENYIAKFVDCLKQHQEELAQAIHQETGKPLWESKTEIVTMIGKAAISGAAYDARTGEKESNVNSIEVRLAHRPIGVFAVLGPYNFPGHLPNGHIIPALLAGNTIVFKPSELTPRFGELMIACWEQAGLPAGVVNLIQGARDTGETLVNAEDINGVLFTGSSKTGHAIHKSLAGQPDKMLALEMGGNNALIIDQVADESAAVYTIIQSAFISAGQRCTCARRLIVVKSVANKSLVKRLIEATEKIKVGSDDSCFIGPVVSNAAADGAMAFQAELLSAGAKSLLAMSRDDASRPFIQPGLIDVTGTSGIVDEECFGPLLQIQWVDDLQAAVEVANSTRYGLSAGLLSDNDTAWDYFYPRINAGIVNFNRPLTGASGSAPFGGIGASGNFRPGAYYAADYCAYPIASMSSHVVELPSSLAPGITL
jgi:succinylglutamic semialdehyde dehydrogenase|tara:strand:+ start:5062 stop:6528 length:1467 start_codon:yes stop_codon:yes gene_type:complete